ncbi:hypothetical protein HYX00_02875 [Candidatus Woesearchaeota archaeon]|nr:hypothetical protein [Candidatus Woesearchaeota archaeon]
MKISIDTKEDSHDEIKKVIKMLQNLVGDSQEIFTNQPISESGSTETTGSPFANIFGDTSPSQDTSTSPETEEATESTESTEDLFAELFSEEELKKMDEADIKNKEEGEDLEVKPKGKKYSIEFY